MFVGNRKYGLNYPDLEEMMPDRGVEVDHGTLFRRVQQYAPEIEKRLRWYYKPGLGESWKIDETYVKGKGKWKNLYRIITKSGKTLDFYLSSTQKGKGAKRFCNRAVDLNGQRDLESDFIARTFYVEKSNKIMTLEFLLKNSSVNLTILLKGRGNRQISCS